MHVWTLVKETFHKYSVTHPLNNMKNIEWIEFFTCKTLYFFILNLNSTFGTVYVSLMHESGSMHLLYHRWGFSIFTKNICQNQKFVVNFVTNVY